MLTAASHVGGAWRQERWHSQEKSLELVLDMGAGVVRDVCEGLARIKPRLVLQQLFVPKCGLLPCTRRLPGSRLATCSCVNAERETLVASMLGEGGPAGQEVERSAQRGSGPNPGRLGRSRL